MRSLDDGDDDDDDDGESDDDDDLAVFGMACPSGALKNDVITVKINIRWRMICLMVVMAIILSTGSRTFNGIIMMVMMSIP